MEMRSLVTTHGTMKIADARPTGKPKGAIIVLQEAFGLTDHIIGLTDRFADAGFRAVAPELFYRVADEAFSYDNFEPIMPVIQSMTAAEVSADLDATIAYLNDEGFGEGSIGTVGFCMGGSLSLFAGTRPGIAAAATFYGGGVATGRFGLLSLVELAPSLRCPWLGLYGDLDVSIPVEEVEDLRVAASSAQVTTEIVRYPNAGHGFHCNDRPDHFNAEASTDAWNRTVRFFEENLER